MASVPIGLALQIEFHRLLQIGRGLLTRVPETGYINVETLGYDLFSASLSISAFKLSPGQHFAVLRFLPMEPRFWAFRM